MIGMQLHADDILTASRDTTKDMDYTPMIHEACVRQSRSTAKYWLHERGDMGSVWNDLGAMLNLLVCNISSSRWKAFS